MRLLFLGGSSDLLCERWYVAIDRVAQEQRLDGKSGLRFAGLAETVAEICSSTTGNVASSLQYLFHSYRLDLALTEPDAVLSSVRALPAAKTGDFQETDYLSLVERIIARFYRSEPAADFFLAQTDSNWLLDNQRANLLVEEKVFRESFMKVVVPACRTTTIPLSSLSAVALSAGQSGPCGGAVKRFLSSTLPQTVGQLEQLVLVKLKQPQLAPLVPSSAGTAPPPTRGGGSADATSAGRSASGFVQWLLRLKKRTRLAHKTAMEHVEEFWLHASRHGCSEDKIIELLGTTKASGIFGTGVAIAKAFAILKYDSEYESEDAYRKGIEYLHLVHDRNYATLTQWPSHGGSCAETARLRQLHLHIIEVPKQGVLADLHSSRRMLTTYIDSMASFVAVRTVGTFMTAMTRVEMFLDRVGVPYSPRTSAAPLNSPSSENLRGYLAFFKFMTRPIPGPAAAVPAAAVPAAAVPAPADAAAAPAGGNAVYASSYLRYAAFKEASRMTRFLRTYAQSELMATLYTARYSAAFHAAVSADARSTGLPIEHLLTTLVPGRPGLEDPKALYDTYLLVSDPRRTEHVLRTSQALPMIRTWIDELMAVAVKNAHAQEVLRLWRVVAALTPALGGCNDVAMCVKQIKMFFAPTAPSSAGPERVLGDLLSQLTQMIERSNAEESEIVAFVRKNFTLRASREEEVDVDAIISRIKMFPAPTAAAVTPSPCEALVENITAPTAAELASLPDGVGDAAVAVADFARLRHERGGATYERFVDEVVVPAFEAPNTTHTEQAGSLSRSDLCGQIFVQWLLSADIAGRSLARALAAGHTVPLAEVAALARGGDEARWYGGVTTRRAVEVNRAIVDLELADSVRKQAPYAAAFFEERETRYVFVKRFAPQALKDLLVAKGALGGKAAVEAAVVTALKMANIRKRHEFWSYAVHCCIAPELEMVKLAEPLEVSRRIGKTLRAHLRKEVLEFRAEDTVDTVAHLQEFVRQTVKVFKTPETADDFDFDGYIDPDEEEERKFHEELNAKGRRRGNPGAVDTMYALEEEEVAQVSVFESLYIWTFTLFAAVALKLTGVAD